MDLIITQAGYSSTNWKLIARMETAGFSSGLWRNANNPWGMHVAKVRPRFQAGAYISEGQMDWAAYSDYNQACKDIVAYMDYTKFPKGKISIQDQVAAMGSRGYFGDESVTSYLAKVIAWATRPTAK